MNLSYETYMKYHVSQLEDLSAEERALWTFGQNSWCMKHHGMSYDEYIAKKDALLKEKHELLDEWNNQNKDDDELKMLREDIDTLTDAVKYQGDEVVHLREDLGILFDLVNSMSAHVVKLDDTVTRLTLEMVKIKENEDE